MSKNYSADLRSHVEPCVFGGNPDCTQCGCSISSALHWIRDIRIAGPLKVDHMVRASLQVGSAVSRLRGNGVRSSRWQKGAYPQRRDPGLVQLEEPVQIQSEEQREAM
jgi:hypothetical protein